MTFLDRLFRKSEPDQGPADIRFGRYSDAYKVSEQYDLWDQSLILFEKKHFLAAYERFLKYLNDPKEGNVKYVRNGQKISFEIIQGSKKLVGTLDNQKLRVEAKVAKITALNEDLLKLLLKFNYDLKYCRYGLTDDNHISIIFDSTTADGSPYKLYYALKEAANHADKQDDLLIHDYKEVKHTNHDLFHQIPEKRKNIKYEYLTDEISRTLEFIQTEEGNMEGYAGGIAYTLLSLAYKLDYLIKPEGYLMDRLEDINSIYFNNNISDVKDKIEMIIEEYQHILDHDATVLKSEMYLVKSTFGITVPVNQDRIVNFIDGELSNMDWYVENGNDEIAKSIPEYIIGYALFHFAPPKPALDLLQLYIRIKESAYFKKLGFSKNYYDIIGSYNKKAIIKAIDTIVDDNHDLYPYLDPDFSKLKYGTSAAFARSFLELIQELDMTKIE